MYILRYILCILFFAVIFNREVSGQDSETSAVNQVVVAFFDAMRAGDSAIIGDLFHHKAQMIRANFHNNEPFLSIDSVEGFLKAVGTPHDKVFDERVWDIKINVEENLATAWMNFAFYLGDNFSHCGVNSFTFFKSKSGWKIIHIADTRSRDCDIPSHIRK